MSHTWTCDQKLPSLDVRRVMERRHPPGRRCFFGARLAAMTVAVALAAAGVLAAEDAGGNEFVTCEGRYALCDAAPCKPIPRQDEHGDPIEPNFAICDCIVPEPGFNIGPTACPLRDNVARLKQHWLVSTYSFALSDTLMNMTCPSGAYTDCYGYPCVVDPDNSKLASCTCAVVPDNGEPFVTLGGNCKQDSCSGTGILWSAATVKADLEANEKLAHDIGLSQPPVEWCVTAGNPSTDQ